MRKCKYCKAVELLPAAKCTGIVEKKGYCSIACLNSMARDKRIAAQMKAERKATRLAREKLKTRAEHLKDAQRWFNKWIRLRDAAKACVSCGNNGGHDKGIYGHNYDAGHYRSVGANPELRFNEDNCFKQCVKCNRDLSGNAANMRIEIIKRIGPDRLAVVEGNHAPKKYTIEDAKAISTQYKARIKELE